MNPAIASKGQSFKGAVAYITHDVGRNSAARVAQTGTFNLRTNDPENAAKVMAWTAAHAHDLKRAAGIPATGRKTADPVYHLALTWEPSQNPTPDEMVRAARSAMGALGLEGHEAVYAIHRDTAHPHIHVVANRIHPETGRTANPHNDYDRLQRWAWQYEKDHGQIYCLERALRYERDPQARAALEHRQATTVERGDTPPNRPRAQWEAERTAPSAREPSAQAIRAETDRQARTLAQDGRDLKERQRQEATELWRGYQDQKRALWAQQHAEHRGERAAEAGHVQAQRDELTARHRNERETGRADSLARDGHEERTRMTALFRAQRQEFRAFLSTSHRQGWIGAIATAVQATRAACSGEQHKPRPLATLARFAGATLSADKRAQMFLAGQKTERDALRAQLRCVQRDRRAREQIALQARHAAERRSLRDRLSDDDKRRAGLIPGESRAPAPRARWTPAREALRARYVADRAALRQRHQAERADLRSQWQAHHLARQQAWQAYRQQRAGREARPPLTRAFGVTNRQADTQRSAPQRTADAGRSRDGGRAPARGLSLRR